MNNLSQLIRNLRTNATEMTRAAVALEPMNEEVAAGNHKIAIDLQKASIELEVMQAALRGIADNKINLFSYSSHAEFARATLRRLEQS